MTSSPPSEKEMCMWFTEKLGMEITPSTQFFDDLWVDEFEIELATHAFIDEFEVDLEGFNFKNYSSNRTTWFSFLFKRKPVYSFTCAHWVEVARRGRWFDVF